MTSVLVDGIGELVTNCPASGDALGIVDNGALVVEGDRIAWVGPSASAPPADRRVDAGGRSVIRSCSAARTLMGDAPLGGSRRPPPLR